MNSHAPAVVGDIPGSDYLPTLFDPDGVAAEGIRTLRTRVVAQHFRVGRRALAICSASDGVGCTFVAANLAISLSQIGINTLLIDGDLRKPSIDKVFGQSQLCTGLRQSLATSASFEDNIRGNVLPKLSILFAGGKASNSQELLGTDRFSNLMSFCLREFSVTIIDTPPAGSSSDANLISNVASYCLIVARRDRSYVNEVKQLAAQLKADHAHVIGSVLTDA